MKPVTRIQVEHKEYQGARLHNDLNKMVQQTNENFDAHQAAIQAANDKVATLQGNLAAALARIVALEAKIGAL